MLGTDHDGDARSRLKRPSLRFGVISFIIFASLVMIGLTGREIGDERIAAVSIAQRQTTNLAQSLAQQVRDSFQNVDTELYDHSERVQNDGTDSAQLARLRKVMAGHVAALPLLHNVFLVDARGNGLVNALGLRNVNYADRAWFVYHRTHTGRGTHIGPVVRSRTDGRPIITVTRRIARPDGTFAGVVLATIDVDYFKRLYGDVNLGTRGLVNLSLADGTILVRKPFDEADIGKSIASSTWFKRDLPRASHGAYVSRSVIDGVGRYIAYQRVEGYPLIVLVGVAQDEALAAWAWHTTLSLVELGCVLLILVWAGRYLVRQIGRREAAEAQLERQALTDPLTGLANRRNFDATLKRESCRAIRSGTPFACLMIDLDWFKAYNDRYGHPAGDRVLRAVAACLSASACRPADLAARYGGEEFAVLLPETTIAGARRVAETIRDALAALRIEHAGSAFGTVTISVGIARMTSDGAGDPAALVQAADAALYEAKRDGRNRIEVMSETAAVSQI